ncbi:T9SS type A sorting domain-containing protein [Siphonobacter aquaeclarae]|uniref:Por secretion system C-terminal sorting domain-containing protein n=1 Tax=Siphonobacter aquaeclarae TaxID=563176 RepID=A0A1G9HJ46_9BACT|nr:T9SS type A sorting domain-containing protein [Siphonobacter aquaeclarae]SDL12754.1 Por secretion system C-terminal sorting domain-containing protein [Siphonobacter aquaeclarae]
MKKILTSLLLIACYLPSVHAQLAVYCFDSGAQGNGQDFQIYTNPATVTGANVTLAGPDNSNTVGNGQVAGQDKYLSAKKWDNFTSRNANQYIEFSFTVPAGHTVTFGQVGFDARLGNGNGTPPAIQLEYSLTGTFPGTVLLPATNLTTAWTKYFSPNVNVSIPGGTTMTFRLFVWNVTGQNVEVNMNNLTLFGLFDGAVPNKLFCGGETSLPVRLVSFGANERDGAASLSWVTASEENSAYFAVEKSTDLRSFETIGTIKAQGTTTRRTTYAFQDKALITTSYYRLRQVDNDGKMTFSQTLSVVPFNESLRSVSVYPSPGNGQLSLSGDKDLRVSVYSADSRKFGDYAVSGRRDIDLSALPNGEYLLVLKTSLEQGTRKVIIRR